MAKKKASKRPLSDDEFFDAAVGSRAVREYDIHATIFAQGDVADTVLYIRKGTVKLAVVSESGKEAVIALLDRGDFFGEGCLAGQRKRMATANAVTAVTVVPVQKTEMASWLHDNRAFSDRFLTHMLNRNIRIEEDLIDQLFNSSEKRLARALLLLARYGSEQSEHVLPKLSQEVLAEMVGTTRSRVNFFMNKFRKLGFIEYNGELKINSSLLSLVLHE
jgi:CRP/FNR family transcriptional regulator, cyclic AMP receptor protein